METEKERKAILTKLKLLADMMRLHEWTIFGRKEVKDWEKADKKADSEAAGKPS